MITSLILRPSVLLPLRGAYRVREYIHMHRPDVCKAREHRSEFYTALWQEAAVRVGASVKELGYGFLEIRFGGAVTRVHQNVTAFDDPVALAIAKNKPLVYGLLAQKGIRTPHHCEFTLDTIVKAIAFMERVGSECVVKPANGGGGEGVTTGVVSRFHLVFAAVAASIYDSDLLIERQVTGQVYRLLYFTGKLLDVVLRKPVSLLGDGKSSIRELVNKENVQRINEGANLAHALIRIDLELRRNLASQRLTLSSVPRQGTPVTLKRVVNDNSRHDNISATNLLCQSIIDDGAAAAAVTGVRLAGIDVITPDPSLPLAESGGAILDVNATPSYHHHYCRDDGGYRVATHILPYLLAEKPSRKTIESVAA